MHVLVRSLQIGETGRENVNTVILETATSPGKGIDITRMTSHDTRTITMATVVPMETPIAALAVTVAAAPPGRGRTTSMTMTEITEVIAPITTGELLTVFPSMLISQDRICVNRKLVW